MVRYVIDTRLPSLNDYIDKCRYNKHTGNKFKQDTDEMCGMYSLPHKSEIKKLCEYPMYFHFEWVEKNHRRDLDNIYSAKKYILDGLQKIRAIPNDSQKYIRGLYDSVSFADRSYVVVSISNDRNEIIKLVR